ncbi:RNA chaperone Hfq [Vulcanibacillus modesticaldus]|uniref:RNA-binding protein Hfq n=1 Tax=Vulcanibacillus modesticaldus TaxID=337097 RepID=A0A1D2YWU4_9BACI|nr:RNA chaperone Hfq [Vulcanibacillus modesticaldus]OEG00174.1 RNA chaperone Hfq [Vulcanibacillus modesticaldus]
MKQAINIQDTFLNIARKENVPVTIFLTNGFQLRGVIRGFDNYIVILESEGKQQMVYKHAISTFVPAKNINLNTDAKDNE